MKSIEQKPGTELEEPRRFETLLAELSVRFISLPAEQVDGAIEEALRLFCDALGLDRSALYQRFDEEPEALLLTHLYQRGQEPPIAALLEKRAEPRLRTSTYWIRSDTPPSPTRVDVKALFPWVYREIQRREPIVISGLEELPGEADVDREAFRRFGTQSTVLASLATGGKWLGCLSFASLGERRQWSQLEVERCRLISDVLANALVRKRADEELRLKMEDLAAAQKEVRNSRDALEIEHRRYQELFESAPDAYLVTNMRGRIVEANRAAQGLLAASAAELRGRPLAEFVAPEDQAAFESQVQALEANDSAAVHDFEMRIRPAQGMPVPTAVSVVVARHLQEQVGLRWLLRDITERKRAEEALQKSYDEIKQLKDRLQAESDFLKAEMKVSQIHGEIVGRSAAIKKVLHQVEQVAPADSSVLVSGETGTGKELVAQEIHRLSRRKDRLMVLVNCAALPSALVESELFGRERGAYTGALSSQVGRFEMADGSTIFLDEVGELSLEVQAKLLRVLQQGEFQRLGSPKSHRVNVRVIAATNRDLAESVRKGTFREDLYYRLRVFPIEVPPLRGRLEDIPLLVFTFMEELSIRMGKKITKVPRKVMEALQRHPWPGNIRELRNVIEHSVILTTGDTLRLSILGDSPTRSAQAVTLAEAERDHIVKSLESTGWRIKGPHGAAARLDLKPSTLYSRMQKLGIPHRRQKDEMPAES
jgi:formate hydrogenlyase transcriptional activator